MRKRRSSIVLTQHDSLSAISMSLLIVEHHHPMSNSNKRSQAPGRVSAFVHMIQSLHCHSSLLLFDTPGRKIVNHIVLLRNLRSFVHIEVLLGGSVPTPCSVSHLHVNVCGCLPEFDPSLVVAAKKQCPRFCHSSNHALDASNMVAASARAAVTRPSSL